MFVYAAFFTVASAARLFLLLSYSRLFAMILHFLRSPHILFINYLYLFRTFNSIPNCGSNNKNESFRLPETAEICRSYFLTKSDNENNKVCICMCVFCVGDSLCFRKRLHLYACVQLCVV